MAVTSRRRFPAKLRDKLFLSCMLFIILPFAALQLYNYNQMEASVEERVSQLNLNQLEQVKTNLDHLRRTVQFTLLQLEKDPLYIEVMRTPDRFAPLERTQIIEQMFKRARSHIADSVFLYYTLADFHGNVYTSYGPFSELDYSRLLEERGMVRLRFGGLSYHWSTESDLYMNVEMAPSSKLYSFYSLAKDSEGGPYSMGRFSFDYDEWIQSYAKKIVSAQTLYIVDATGKTLVQSKSNAYLPQSVVDDILGGQGLPVHFFHKPSASIIDSTYMPSYDWYLVSEFPLNLFFGDLAAMKRQMTVSITLVALLFILISLLIAHSITRPLQQLQKVMAQTAHKGLKVRIDEGSNQGEVLSLITSFNAMIQDLNRLVQQLKLEERQKEYIRYQMLLSQMNPHFLLNTLNSIKWIALDQNNKEIPEICLSLGKLLESGLYPEQDLIHLKDELELIAAYIQIQKHRYGEQFGVTYAIEPGLEYALVPKLSLQPLVENSIYHGFAGLEEGGRIIIRIFSAERKLIVEVEDNGIGLHASSGDAGRKRKGIGLKNVEERLALQFKQEMHFELRALPQGTLVAMAFPLMISEPYSRGVEAHVENADRGR